METKEQTIERLKKEIERLNKEIIIDEKRKGRNQFSKRILKMLDGQIRLKQGAIKELEQQIKELEGGNN